MKTLTRSIYVFLVVFAITALPSCKKATVGSGTGSIEFSLNMPVAITQLKSAAVDSGIVSYQLLISAEDMKGNSILSDKLVPLYAFGSGFVSERVQIPAGEFKLTKFMIVNPSGAVIYATPLAKSPLGYITAIPLPLRFIISSDKVTTIAPEVINVGNQAPSQFGYAAFGIQIINPLDFYTYCVLSSDSTQITSPVVMTNAKVTISDNKGWTFTFGLTNASNHLVIRGGSEIYTFMVSKEGYATRILTFTSKQLVAATKENPLVLKIPTGSVTTTQIMYFQPGPEDGRDAMISDLEPGKNFGAHKYFEATYMTESVLTVMRTNKSLIFFNLNALPKSAVIKKVMLKLFYDIPIPWDSTIFFAPNLTTLVKACGIFQQVIEPWEENSITWNNQPKTTEVNQVYLFPFIKNANFIEVDITGLIVIPATNALPNNGILFKLYPNERFKGFRFASSDYPEATMRPKLSVQYTVSK
jgi:hypothetical protein